MILDSVYNKPQYDSILYNLLSEREPYQSISHQSMPSYAEHLEFYESRPYKHWFMILNDDQVALGAVYLTHNNEIGIHIFKQFRGRGYGLEAVEMLMAKYPGETFLANVNPSNEASIRLFQSLGGEHIQNTYRLKP